MTPADEDSLRELARSVVGRVGTRLGDDIDLEDVVVVAAGRRSLVRVIVDGDHGINLDAAAEISRDLAAELDAAEAAGTSFLGDEPYTLEVTSPGVGRPLTEERHFRRARGRLITVTLNAGDKIEGRVRRVTEGSLELLASTEATVTVIPLADIRRAKVEVEFGKMPPAHVALLDADGFVDPARAFDEVPADEFTDEDLTDDLELDEDDLDDLDTDDLGDLSDLVETEHTRDRADPRPTTTEEGQQ